MVLGKLKTGTRRSKQEVIKSITGKLQKVDNIEALEILDKMIDKPGIAQKLVKNQWLIRNI